jgi:hypothetical protein
VPFLRVLRDKRGYETTYLVQWFRDGNRQRSRVLYVFRTPPGVRVGRDALDPEVVREIESLHPDIEFDWRALFENRQIVDNTPDPRRRGKAEREPRKRRKEGEEEAPATAAPPAPAETAPPVAVPPPRLVVPGAIEGDTRELQLAFLARWYLELRERVPHRTHDPIRREALMGLVERLNAAAWETEEQIAQGLVAAGEALHRLSRVFSKRRRRRSKTEPKADVESGKSESGESESEK